MLKRPWILVQRAGFRKARSLKDLHLSEDEDEDKIAKRNEKEEARKNKSRAMEVRELAEHMKMLSLRDEAYEVEVYQYILDLCIKLRARAEGIRVHEHIRRNRMEAERFVGNSLVFMYAEFGDVNEAKRIFDILGQRNLFSFIGLIRAYVNADDPDQALKLFQIARLRALRLDESLLALAVQACGMKRSLDEGIYLHGTVRRNGMEYQPEIAGALIGMYANCGELGSAVEVFQKVKHLGRVRVWNSLIAAYAQNGHPQQAFKLFREMNLEGLPLNPATFELLLGVCSSQNDLQAGKFLQRCIESKEWFGKFFQALNLKVALMKMYSACGRLDEAVSIFQKLPMRDFAAWKAMLQGWFRHGKKEETLQGFIEMQQEGFAPDREIFLSVLQLQPDLKICKKTHASIVRHNVAIDPEVREKLAAAYAATKEGRNGDCSMHKVQERVLRWVEKKKAAESYVHSYFNFQD